MAEILWDCTQRPYYYGNQNHFTAAPPQFPFSTLIPFCPPFLFLFLNNTAVKTAWHVLNIAVSSTFSFPPQELQYYMVWNSPWSYLFESYPKELFTFIIIIINIMMIVVIIIIIIIIIRACNVNSPLIEGKRTRLPASHLSWTGDHNSET